MASTSLRMLELSVDLVKALAWPLLIVGLVAVFHQPLWQIAGNFAVKLEQANKLTVGSFSMEVAVKAREAGDPVLAEQVGSLSSAAVEQLLHTPTNADVVFTSASEDGGSTGIGVPSSPAIQALQELEKKGFLQFREPLVPFLERLRKLPAIGTGSSSLNERDWYRAPSSLDSPEVRRLRNQSYSLTERGKTAVDSIVKAVASQLPKSAA